MTSKYGAILADPPWAFLTYSGKHVTAHRCAEDHYLTMSTEELRALPVASWAAQDCALFLWTVDSHLDEALKLMDAWGFKYKTVAFVWVKVAQNGTPRIGMSYWTRKSAELCLLGVPRVAASAEQGCAAGHYGTPAGAQPQARRGL